MNEVKTLSDANNFLALGKDTTIIIKKVAEEVTKKNSTQLDTESVFNGIQDIFSIIDYDELNKITHSIPTKQGLMAKIFKKKDKVMAKYLGLSKSIQNIYMDVSAWETQLQDNKTMFDSMETDLLKAKENLDDYITQGTEMASDYKATLDENSTEEQKEIYNIMQQKVQELQYNNIVCDQSLASIDVMRKTNYDVFKKLHQVKNTTMPHLEILINQTLKLKESKQMIESFKYLDDKARELVEFGTKEVIELSKDAVTTIGVNKADIDAMMKSTENLREAISEINKLKEQRIEEISQTVKDYNERKMG